MQHILLSFVIIHVIAGYTAFIAAPLALFLKKGSSKHKRVGNVFYYSMTIGVVSALILSLAKQNAFLFHLSVFTFYMNYTGRRSIRNKALKPDAWDIFFLLVSLVNAVFMISSFQTFLLVFGVLQGFFTLTDARLFYRVHRGKTIHPLSWLFRHIGRMTGAYIAATTAFLVVNLHSGMPWIPWLLPTLIGTPLIVYFIYSVKRNSGVFRTFILLILMIPFVSDAQPYMRAKTRHRFAQLTLGTDHKMHLSHRTSTVVWQNNALKSMPLDNSLQSRLIIGGTHFWGHADFYIALPVVNYGRPDFYSTVETGFRYIPLRIQHDKLRPFFGLSHLPVIYRQGEGASAIRFRYPLQAGFIFNHGRHLVEFSGGYVHHNNMDYFIDPSQVITVNMPSYSLNLGYKLMLETTVSGEREWLNGHIGRLTDTLAKQKRLNGFTLAAGPSASFFLKPSSYNRNKKPYLDDHKVTNTLLDLGLGYYMHSPDLQVNLAYRSSNSHISAFGASQLAKRRAITLEIYKFFADYHGFCPFIGPAISYEHLVVKESEGAVSENGSFRGFKPGITCGWDIRPNRILSWYLRTNIRYFPNMRVIMPGGGPVPFDQLEVNFIQLVILPERLNLLK